VEESGGLELDILRNQEVSSSEYDYDLDAMILRESERDQSKPSRPPIPPRPCRRGSLTDDHQNCTERYHFPSAVLMIEAHYNQTVRDFLQICTPVETVEINNVDDMQDLLNSIYSQMSAVDQVGPSSIVLLANLENYANWTKDKVVEVLETTVDVLHNDFNDMMIYSKFHQDGADSNDTQLMQLIYDIKYWLSNLCNQRLTPCADFASIILESVLQLNNYEDLNAGPNHEDPASQADIWCRQLGMGPGSRIIDIRPPPWDPLAGFNRFPFDLSNLFFDPI